MDNRGYRARIADAGIRTNKRNGCAVILPKSNTHDH
jgi:hypothetical protein